MSPLSLVVRAGSFDVGCAEGYYAVGLALRLPEAHVVAFDIDSRSLGVCADMATLNGVRDRIEFRARCTPSALSTLCGSETLLVMDCEGCELDLLDPGVVTSLRSTRIIAEMHDFVMAGTTKKIASRFAPTHDVSAVVAEDRRRAGPHPVLATIPLAVQRVALDELRPMWPEAMRWLIMTPHRGNP